jgi:ABC-type antimicrobial peptide transport system permease subunit
LTAPYGQAPDVSPIAGLVAVVACLLPARRAARVKTMIALRAG